MLQETMPTHLHQSAAPPAQAKKNLCWTVFCIYVASLMDFDVCHLILYFSLRVINFNLVYAFILFVFAFLY